MGEQTPAITPPEIDGESEREIETRAKAMKDQLRKDVATWSKARHEGEGGLPLASAPPVPKRAPVKSAARAARAAPVPAAKPAEAPGKPFRMSYSGSSTADYIKYMRDRGAK